MEKAAAEVGAISETIVFLKYFKDLPEPGQRGKVVYPLEGAVVVPIGGAGRSGNIGRDQTIDAIGCQR